MKKLALKLDDLQVKSFDTTSAGPADRGTVRGNTGDPYCNHSLDAGACAGPPTYPSDCPGFTCFTCPRYPG